MIYTLTSLNLLFLPINERVSFDRSKKAQDVKDLHTKVYWEKKMNKQCAFNVNKGRKRCYFNEEIEFRYI